MIFLHHSFYNNGKDLIEISHSFSFIGPLQFFSFSESLKQMTKTLSFQSFFCFFLFFFHLNGQEWRTWNGCSLICAILFAFDRLQFHTHIHPILSQSLSTLCSPFVYFCDLVQNALPDALKLLMKKLRLIQMSCAVWSNCSRRMMNYFQFVLVLPFHFYFFFCKTKFLWNLRDDVQDAYNTSV